MMAASILISVSFPGQTQRYEKYICVRTECLLFCWHERTFRCLINQKPILDRPFPIVSVSKRVLVRYLSYENSFYSHVSDQNLHVNKTSFQTKGLHLDSLWNRDERNGNGRLVKHFPKKMIASCDVTCLSRVTRKEPSIRWLDRADLHLNEAWR